MDAKPLTSTPSQAAPAGLSSVEDLRAEVAALSKVVSRLQDDFVEQRCNYLREADYTQQLENKLLSEGVELPYHEESQFQPEWPSPVRMRP